MVLVDKTPCSNRTKFQITKEEFEETWCQKYNRNYKLFTHKLIKSIIERKNNVLSVDILREAHQHKSIFYYFYLILHEQLIIDTWKASSKIP